MAIRAGKAPERRFQVVLPGAEGAGVEMLGASQHMSFRLGMVGVGQTTSL